MSYEQAENTDSFRFTRRKKQNRRMRIDPTIESSSSSFDHKQLLKNLENKIQLIRSSYFWLQLQDYLQQWISRQLTSIDILCYGLGHLNLSLSSQYQYALLKLIEERFEQQIQIIYLYDPIWTNDEYNFLEKTNTFSKYELFKENNQACQTILRPSLIYIPFCSKPIHNNLLYSNWMKDKLKEICIFGNSFEKFSNEVQFDEKKYFYIYQSTSFLTETSLPSFDNYTNAFHEQVFTTFDRNDIPIVNEKSIRLTKRDKQKKNLLNKTTIEQIPEDIWLTNLKPIYSNDDEIVVR